MKRVFTISIIVIMCFSLSSCKITPTNKQNEYNEESNISENTKEPVSDNTEDILDKYLELYSAKYVFSDIFNNKKFVLISDNNIVEIIAIEGIEQITQIPIINIERVENKTITEFNEIKVYDKTNQYISIILESEKANELIYIIG